jgi:hypothetical protein
MSKNEGELREKECSKTPISVIIDETLYGRHIFLCDNLGLFASL